MKSKREYDPQTLATIRNVAIVALIIDVFGIYWFLKARALGILIFIIAMGILGLVLILERRQDNKMNEDYYEEDDESPDDEEIEYVEIEKKRTIPKKKKKKKGFIESTGLPSSEEYNERLNKAVGVGDMF